MLESLTIDSFKQHQGSKFRMRVGAEQVIELELTQVTPLAAESGQGAPPQGRVPFSLLFRGPGNLVVPQRIYPIEHDALGSLELFVVPVGPGHGGMLYEIIFG